MNRAAVHQYYPDIRAGTSVANEMFALQRALRAAGRESEVFTREPDPASGLGTRPWSEYSAKDGDLLLVHYANWLFGYNLVFPAPGRKVLVYHGVLPEQALAGMDAELADRAHQARRALPAFANLPFRSVVHSTFSRADLERAGYRGIETIPYLMDAGLYEVDPDEALLKRFGGDSTVNLLAVGSIAPHKRLEEAIFLFHYFQRHLYPKSRLILAGGDAGMTAYRRRLDALISQLHLTGVVFTGALSQRELIACYRRADVFLSMGEHEHTAVPLVEAMLFDLPIFAYSSGAVPEVLETAGVLLRDRDPAVAAEAIALVLEDPRTRERLLDTQRERVREFNPEPIAARWLQLIESVLVQSED